MAKEPKENEFWWAYPPDGGDPQPVQIVAVRQAGDHQMITLGSADYHYARQWSLVRRIAGHPRS